MNNEHNEHLSERTNTKHTADVKNWVKIHIYNSPTQPSKAKNNLTNSFWSFCIVFMGHQMKILLHRFQHLWNDRCELWDMPHLYNFLLLMIFNRVPIKMNNEVRKERYINGNALNENYKRQALFGWTFNVQHWKTIRELNAAYFIHFYIFMFCFVFIFFHIFVVVVVL